MSQSRQWKRWMLLLMLICSPFTLKAQQRSAMPTPCPWMTIGSAEHLLGGPVGAVVHSDDNGFGSCIFTRNSTSASTPASKQSTLSIFVENVDPRACPANAAKVSGIGNEAVQCVSLASAKEPEYILAGRVREKHFRLVAEHLPVSFTERPKRINEADPYPATALEMAAEQVAGNLY